MVYLGLISVNIEYFPCLQWINSLNTQKLNSRERLSSLRFTVITELNPF